MALSDNVEVMEKTFIEIIVNGESYRIAGDSSVVDLVNELKIAPERVAIEFNRSILPRASWAETRLKDGDRLEVVHFVGGGGSEG
jgi:thiamine biosynthesis protein ThiS